MTTAELLGAMTDPGLFERLATSILRIAEEDCKAVIHCGVNAQGQPINALTDGFVLVPRTEPARFILLAHTIEDSRRLRRKWLGGGRLPNTRKNTGRLRSRSRSTVADIDKAARLAKEVRSRFPEATFKVILTTNQRLKLGLAVEVAAEAKRRGLDCGIWEQSALADFLDTCAEGQWIRKQYLGVEAELLSGPLLTDLSRRSLARFKADFLLTPPDSWVARREDDCLDAVATRTGPALVFLRGPSGMGKSAAAYRAMARHTANGGSALWFPADRVVASSSLINATNEVLKDLHSCLAAESGEIAISLAQNDSPLMIVIDDANRLNQPVWFIRKVCTWLNECTSEHGDKISGHPGNVVILLPVWPRLWSVLPSEVREQALV